MFKDFLMKQMIKRQLKNVPPDEQEKVLKMVEKNPDLFAQIAKEVDQKMKGGMSQMDAAMELMRTHQEELKKIMN